MGVDLFSLNVKMRSEGFGQVMTDLKAIELAGKDAALGATNFSNAWVGAMMKFKGTAAELAAYKAEFSAGFFDEKMIAGMSLAGQEAAKAGEGSAKWAAGMANIRAQNEEQTKTLGPLTSALRNLVLVYAGFKAFEFVHGTIEAAGALHELSQKTGATVETLSVLKFAGAQAEVGTEQIATGFRGMAVSLGNLRDGMPSAEAAFAKLGFTAKSFQGLNPDQTFIKLATAVGGYADKTQRADLAQTVFGRSGNQLLPLLEDIAEKGFGAIRKETEEGGGLFTKEMADKADNFTDAITRLTAAFRGLAINGLLPVLPILTAIVDKIGKGVGFIEETFGPYEKSRAFKAGYSSVTGRDPDWKTFHEAGGLRGDEAGMGTRAPGALTDTLGPVGIFETRELAEFAKRERDQAARDAKQKADEHRKAMLALLNVVAPDKLAGGGGISGESNIALRGGGVSVSPVGIPGGGSAGDEFMGGSLGGDLESLFAQGGDGKSAAGKQSILAAFANEAKRQAVQLKVQFATLGQALGGTLASGFASALSAGMSGKNVFKSFGDTVLKGLGSIFASMGQAMIGAALPLIKLLPFLSNPLTSGPALLTAGIILTALGATLGGIATGHGGHGSGGGGDFGDRTTNITLTPAGMGGNRAPAGQQPQHFHVLGIDSPQGTSLLGKGMTAAKRMNKA